MPSATASAIARTCGSESAEQMTKKSVMDVRARRSMTITSDAFLVRVSFAICLANVEERNVFLSFVIETV
jgi:hypothetical protein